MNPRFVRKTLVAALAAAGIGTALADGRHHHGNQALVDARTKIFGIENVDQRSGDLPKDKVVFSWLGHNTGAVSLRGRVIMLDTFIARLEVTPGRTPFVIRDIVDMKPEALFIGHGHGDHADNAAFIAAKTGATIYMSPEACGTAQNALTRMKNDPFMKADPFFAIPPDAIIRCAPVTTAGSVPGMEVVRIRQLEPLVCVNAFRSLHSVAVPVDPDWGPIIVVDTPDPRDRDLFPPGTPLTPSNPRRPGQQDLRQGAGPGGPDQINFQFVVRAGTNFALFFNASVGAMKEGKGSNWLNGTPADGERILNLLRKMPPTDLAFSTVSSGNTDENGWRDHVYWAEALRPKIMTTGHAPVGAALQYYSGFMSQLRLMEKPRAAWPGFPNEDWPIVRNHTDPTDILKPQVYEIDSPAWADPKKENKRAMREFCG
jgi:hypothetical protein